MSNNSFQSDPDNFGDTVIAFLEIKMQRSGMMSIGGSITDENSILGMIDTARATLVENFKANRKSSIIVPGYDTALTGTEYEKKLITSIDDLYKAKDTI